MSEINTKAKLEGFASALVALGIVGGVAATVHTMHEQGLGLAGGLLAASLVFQVFLLFGLIAGILPKAK